MRGRMRAQYSRADSGGLRGSSVGNWVAELTAQDLGDATDLSNAVRTRVDDKGDLMSEDVGVEHTLVIVVESSELCPILTSTLFVDNGDAVADELPRVTGYEDFTVVTGLARYSAIDEVVKDLLDFVDLRVKGSVAATAADGVVQAN